VKAEEEILFLIQILMNTKSLKKYVELSKSMMPQDHGVRTFHTTFVLNKSKVVAIGINNVKTHPATLKYNYCGQVGLHSELSAVIKLGKEDCSDLTFVNVRVKKNGSIGTSLPCRGCMDMLNQVGFKKVYFTNEKGDFTKLK
jgi:deoxycytidylate deaminase